MNNWEKNIEAMQKAYKKAQKDKGKNLPITDAVGQSELLIALQNIEKICDNQNTTHEEIWRIAYEAINSHCY